MAKSHANLNAFSRTRKAEKIYRLCLHSTELKKNRMLEIGCGSGFIAQHFSHIGYSYEGAHAVDVADERQVTNDFQFQQVSGTNLPFPENYFDLIISNHVIEHVGNEEEQRNHVKEAYRCLEPGGVLYLAVPNKWCLIEPHYKLPFLSWLPPRYANRYVSLLGAGNRYDCKLLERAGAHKLLASCNFHVNEATLEAIPLAAEIEGKILAKILQTFPRMTNKLLGKIIPTLIFVCKKPSNH